MCYKCYTFFTLFFTRVFGVFGSFFGHFWVFLTYGYGRALIVFMCIWSFLGVFRVFLVVFVCFCVCFSCNYAVTFVYDAIFRNIAASVFVGFWDMFYGVFGHFLYFGRFYVFLVCFVCFVIYIPRFNVVRNGNFRCILEVCLWLGPL